jgi:hypothetical protein
MFTNSNAQKMHYVLRIATAMCFIGHGAFGIITKPVWCNYFAVFGIGRNMAYQLMPVVGMVDIIMGITMLFYPVRAVAGWLVMWGAVTASLRPVSGEPFAEMIERAGNFGVPLALLLLHGISPFNIRSWFKRISPCATVAAASIKQVKMCLQAVVFLLLLGHGWLNIIEKNSLLGQYTSLGFSSPAQVAHIIGIAEIGAAFMVLIRPARPLLLVFFIWKAFSELFYPHYEIFEWVERGGSYGSILALWLVVKPGVAKTKRQFLLNLSLKPNV